MKKRIFIFLLFISLIFTAAYSQETEEDIEEDSPLTEETTLMEDTALIETPADAEVSEISSETEKQFVEPEKEEVKYGFFDRGRTNFAIGLDLDAGVSNSYIKIKDIFFNNNPDGAIELDFPKMAKSLPPSGFSLSGLVNLKLYLDIYIKSKAEFGSFTTVDVYAFGSMPKSLINLLAKGNVDNKFLSGKFTASSSAFAGTGLFYGMTIKNFKFRASGTYFVPLFYVPYDGLKYELVNDSEGKFRVKGGGELSVYTPMPLFNNNTSIGSIFKNGGFDLSFDGTYKFPPLANLNFGLKHIPLVPAKMDKGTSFQVSAGYEIESLFTYMNSIIDKTNTPEIKQEPFEMKSGGDGTLKRINVFRPIKLSVGADIFPFSNRYLIISPNLGLQFLKPFYVDAGLKLETNFLKVLGVYYSFAFEDRLWKNRLGTFVDLRAFRLETSIAAASPSFVGSFRGAGFELGLGLVFGY